MIFTCQFSAVAVNLMGRVAVRFPSRVSDVVDELLKDALTLVLHHLMDAFDGAAELKVPFQKRRTDPEVIGVHGTDQGSLGLCQHPRLFGKLPHVFADILATDVRMLEEGAELFAAFSESLVLDADVDAKKPVELLAENQAFYLSLAQLPRRPRGTLILEGLLVLDALTLLGVLPQEVVPLALRDVEGFVVESFGVLLLQSVETMLPFHLLRWELVDVLPFTVVVMIVAAKTHTKKDV